jgi:hypothetical protein
MDAAMPAAEVTRAAEATEVEAVARNSAVLAQNRCCLADLLNVADPRQCGNATGA